jgi:hypothetical protein
MNSETNIENTEAQIEFPTAELTVNTGYIKLEESQDTPATVITAEPRVNAGGKPFIALTLQLAEGRTSHKMWVSTPAAAANTLRQLNRAFGIKAFTELPSIVDQKCSISSRFDDYSQRITVAYINRYNEHANDVVDLSSLDALAASVPETTTDLASVEF